MSWLKSKRSRPQRRNKSKRRPPVQTNIACFLQRLEQRLCLDLTGDYWNNPKSGNWDDPNNWSGGVPTSANVALFPNSGVNYKITIPSGDADTVGAIKLYQATPSNPTLSIAGSLTINGGVENHFDGELEMDGGSLMLSGAGTKLVLNASQVPASSLGGNFVVQGGADLEFPDVTDLGGAASFHYTDTGGSTIKAPMATELSSATVTTDGTDPGLTAAWTRFNNGTLNITGGNQLAEASMFPQLTDIDGSSINVSNGAAFQANSVTQYTSSGSTFSADGQSPQKFASIIALPNLTSVSQPGPWTISATNGGRVSLSALTSLNSTKGVSIAASLGGIAGGQQAGGEIDLNALTSLTGTGISISDTGGSTIKDPLLTNLSNTSVYTDGTDAGLAASWTSLIAGSLAVSGTVTLPGLVDIDGTSLSTTGITGSLTLPGVLSYVLNQSTAAARSTSAAIQGGAVIANRISLPNLATLTVQSGFNVQIDVTGTTLDLSKLTRLRGNASIKLPKFGTLLDPNLTTLDGATVTLAGINTQAVNAWTSFTNGSLSVTGGSYTLANLADLDGSTVHVSGGSSLALPGLAGYSSNGNTFSADGLASALDVSALTNVTQKGAWTVSATNRATINLAALTSLNATQGATLTDTGSATVLDAKLTNLNGVRVTLDGTDPTVADSWTSLTNGALMDTIGGMYTLPALTDIDGSSLQVCGGGTLALPGLASYSSNANTFGADGAGSVLDVSGLTKLTQQGAWTVNATKGGTVNLSALISLAGTKGITITDTGGSTVVDPKLATLSGVSVSLDGTDANIANSWTSFTAGSLTINSGSYNLPGLTDVDGSSLSAIVNSSPPPTLILPGVTSYRLDQNTAPIGATGTVLNATGYVVGFTINATLSLPNLHSLIVAPNAGLSVEIDAGSAGTINVPTLTLLRGQIAITNAPSAGTDGTIFGTINYPAPDTGGPLALDTPTSGIVTAKVPVNDWTIAGQAGEVLSATVITGSQGFPNPWPPDLNYAQLSVTDSQGNVLASANNTQRGANVALAGVVLPAAGTYHLLVQPYNLAPPVYLDYRLTAEAVTSTPATIAATEGSSFSGTVATFSDPAATGANTFSATIAWGDGQSSTGTVSAAAGGGFAISGTHLYSEEGNALPLVITINDGAVTVTANGTANVADAALTAGTNAPIAAGTTVSGVVASFSDADTSDGIADYVASIDWGDGQSAAGSIVAGATAGTFNVTGNHAYTDNSSHTINVTVTHGSDQPLVVKSVEPGQSFNLQGNFGLVEDIYVIGTGTVNVPAAGGVLQNDSAPSQLTVTSGTVPGANGGTFVFHTDGSFTYAPPSSFPGYDYAPYAAADAQGDHGTATVNVLSQPGGVVWKFYESVLNRDPDVGGLKFWVNDFVNGGKTGDIAVGFFESPELLNRIIDGYYEQYLLRPADPSGLDHWKQVWSDNGGPEKIRAFFAESAEFYASAGGTPDTWINALYQRILARAPDAKGEQDWLTYYHQQVAAGVDPAAVRYNIAIFFLTSAEGFGDDVTGWFNEYLQRAPTADELQHYVNEMLAGESDRQIEQEITNLPEYGANPPASPTGTAVQLPEYHPPQSAMLAARDALFGRL